MSLSRGIENSYCNIDTCGRYYKLITIVNDDSRVVNKLEASLIDNTNMFIVQATGGKAIKLLQQSKLHYYTKSNVCDCGFQAIRAKDNL
jgi:hypothetical protein